MSLLEGLGEEATEDGSTPLGVLGPRAWTARESDLRVEDMLGCDKAEDARQESKEEQVVNVEERREERGERGEERVCVVWGK
jgi:hypothetical protein